MSAAEGSSRSKHAPPSESPRSVHSSDSSDFSAPRKTRAGSATKTRAETTPRLTIHVEYPEWVYQKVDWARRYTTPKERMKLAIDLSRENIRHGGGPFGAAIFEAGTGKLVSVGMNLVVGRKNSTLHAEMVAIQMAEQRIQSFALSGKDKPSYVLATSCEPCAMCLGATLWSGVSQLLTGAAGDDARKIGFDEGPVFPESYDYLRKAGVEISKNVDREDAKNVLEEYVKMGGPIYNG